ncbi:MAG: xylulokinase [Kaistia sp. SCN 65-12]|nr:MAG: xylulokinase [Kaistia sp. SCN 65-12]
MYLGIDVGTTATKAILVDEQQHILARATQEYATSRPGPGASEQDPALWIAALRFVLAALRQSRPEAFAAVRALGFSGQMHSLVTLDANHEVVRPAILWNDGRGAEQCAEMTAGVPGLAEISGVRAMTSFTAAKLLWVRQNEPQLYDRVAHVLLAKDYVRFWLTGELASDMSDAGGTQLFDQARREWSTAILDGLGIDRALMPPLMASYEIAGRLRPSVAAELGLRAGLPVACGGADVGTGAIGLGCAAPGTGFISLGTGLVYFVAQDRFAPKPDLYLHNFAHCTPGWYQMAAMLNGASTLSWARKLVGAPDVGDLLSKVEARYSGPSSLMFLPYLSGERTPHGDSDLRGAFFGLSPASDPVDIAQAVIEGVAFSVRQADELLTEAGSHCAAPGLIGGGAQSLFWCRVLSSVLGRDLVRYDDADLGPSLGAARLAMIGEGGFDIAEIATAPEREEMIVPLPGQIERYNRRYETFKAMFPAVSAYSSQSIQ